MFRILYRDEHYVAIDKPPGWVVHRTHRADGAPAVLQSLRNQVRQHVYPVHRLDRATSGVLLFALNSNSARLACELFASHQVDKGYVAVVRGTPEASGIIDHPIADEPQSVPQPALTQFVRLATATLPIPVGRYSEARYSLLRLSPKTGRLHQIRKHLHHISHPIVGDTTHGDGNHNRLFRSHLGVDRMLLYATQLVFHHPFCDAALTIQAPPDDATLGLMERLGWGEVSKMEWS